MPLRELSALDAIYQRRAVRSYLPDTVDEATIRRLLDAAVHAPTAMHTEPWSFVVVQDRAVLTAISDRCWLAADSLILAAPAIRLGTCCIGFALPALHTPEVKYQLGIPDGTDAVAAIIVGFPRGETPAVARKAPHVLRWLKPFGQATGA